MQISLVICGLVLLQQEKACENVKLSHLKHRYIWKKGMKSHLVEMPLQIPLLLLFLLLLLLYLFQLGNLISLCGFILRRVYISWRQWLGSWICYPEVPSSIPPPCHWMALSLVIPDSAPPRFVNSQLVSLPPIGMFKAFLCNLQYLFAHFSVLN